MKLTPTQRLLACTAMKIKPEELRDLLGLSNLPQGIKDEVTSPIVFLTKLRQNCGSIRDFILKLREMLTMTPMFSDLRSLVECLCEDCQEGDLRMTSGFPVGMAEHRPSERQKADFNKVLFRVSEMIPRTTLSIMITVTPIPDGKKERISKGYQLFEEMQQCGFISENDIEFLEDLLGALNLTKPLEFLELYKREHPPIQYDSFTPRQPMQRSSQASGSFTSLPAFTSPRPPNMGGARYGSMPEATGSSRQPSAVVGGNGYTRSLSADVNSLPSGSYGPLPSDAGSLQSENYSMLDEGRGNGPSGLDLHGRGGENGGRTSLQAGGHVLTNNSSLPHESLHRHLQRSKSSQFSSPSASGRQNGTIAIPHDSIYPGPQVHLPVAALSPGSHTRANGPDPEQLTPSAPPPPFNPHFPTPHAPRPSLSAELEPATSHQLRREKELTSPPHHEQAAEVTASTINTEDSQSTLASMSSSAPSLGEASLQSYESSIMHNGHSHQLPPPQGPQQREVSGPKRFIHGNFSSLESPGAQPTANMRQVGINSPPSELSTASIPSFQFQSELRPSHQVGNGTEVLQIPQERQYSGSKGCVHGSYSSPVLPRVQPAPNFLQTGANSNTPSQSAAASQPQSDPRPSDPLPSAQGSNAEVLHKPQERETTGPKKFVHRNFSSPQVPPGRPAANVRFDVANTPSNTAATYIPAFSKSHSDPGAAPYQLPAKKSSQSLQKGTKAKNKQRKEMSLRQRQAVPRNFNQNVEKSVAPSSLNLEEQSTVLPPAKRPLTNQAAASASSQAYNPSQAGHRRSQIQHQRASMASRSHSTNEMITSTEYTSPPPNMAHRSQSMESISSNKSLLGQELAQCSDAQTSLYPSVPSGAAGSSLGDDRRMTRSSRKRDAETRDDQSSEATSKRSRTEPLSAPKEKTSLLEKMWSFVPSAFRSKKKKEEVSVNTTEHDEEDYHSCEEGEEEEEK